MGNKTKGAAQAAQQQKPAPKVNSQAEQDFAKIVKTSQGGLSGDSKVLLASLIDKRWASNPNLPASVVDGANILADALMGDVIATNIAEGKELFALIVRKDEQKYLAISAMLAEQGIKTPDFKSLPAPSQKQLDEAGVKLLPSETKVVTISKTDVSEEVIEQKKAEIANEKKQRDVDPTKVENVEQLKDSLLALLTSPVLSPDKRIQHAINFLLSYKTIQANKAENKDEELEKIKNTSRSTILREIIDIVGKCPFAVGGIGKMLFNTILDTGSPISAFCLYRRSSTNAAGETSNPDDFTADVVKMLITWTCKTNIENAEHTIAEAERAIEKQKGKAKKEFETTIKAKKEEIDLNNAVMDIVNNPTMDVVDKLIENFNSDKKEDEDYKISHRIVKNIKDAYYKKVVESDDNKDALLANCQQHAGVIVNLFRDALDSTPAYSLANLVDIPEGKAEEKKDGEGEGEGKN